MAEGEAGGAVEGGGKWASEKTSGSQSMLSSSPVEEGEEMLDPSSERLISDSARRESVMVEAEGEGLRADEVYSGKEFLASVALSTRLFTGSSSTNVSTIGGKRESVW